MKLNIVTAASSSVGQAILEKIANPTDFTLGLSRKGGKMENVLDVKITDLTNKEKTQQELSKILSTVNIDDIDAVHVYHGCGFVVAEVPSLSSDFPDFFHSKVVFKDQLDQYDLDGDGIDDRTYHALLSTFRNVSEVVLSKFKDKKTVFADVLSLMDKKVFEDTSTGESTIFGSMIRANKIFRKELKKLTQENSNIQSVIISASTVNTTTESNFRKYSPDMKYWASCEMIADALVQELAQHSNTFKDIDIYIPHPEYNTRFANETDDQMTERIKQEIGLFR